MTESNPEPVEAPEDQDQQAPEPAPAPKVRVPTHVDAFGEAEYVEAAPGDAWQWDARRWERLA